MRSMCAAVSTSLYSAATASRVVVSRCARFMRSIRAAFVREIAACAAGEVVLLVGEAGRADRGVERVDELEDADHLVVEPDQRDREDRPRAVAVGLIERAVEVVLDARPELVDVLDLHDLAGRRDVSSD